MTVRMQAPQRRRQLLDAALPCFARKGYRGTTTAELASAAGITPPILYRHFESKRDLFAVLLNEAAARLVESWRKRLDGVGDPRRRRRALADAVSAAWGTADQRLILRAMSEAEGDAVIAGGVQRSLQRIRGFVAGELKTLQDARVVRTDTPPRQLARRLISAAVGDAITTAPGAPRTRAESSRWIESLVALPDKRPAG
ncbi:MAG: TetR/AcrR family transcriptional regulator [Planctomycetota bacterium]|jgi:AcrR family transcriptional regulator